MAENNTSAASTAEPRLGKRLFSFAVVADTHVNQDETTCNSPFEVNRLANARMRHVVRELNSHDVAFVVHLGDLVGQIRNAIGFCLDQDNRRDHVVLRAC